MASHAGVTPREPSSLRVLTLTTRQQAGLTSIRFGLPILALYWREAFQLSPAQVGVLMGAFDLGALQMFFPIGPRRGGGGARGRHAPPGVERALQHVITGSVSPHRAATAMGVCMTLLYSTTMVAPPLLG